MSSWRVTAGQEVAFREAWTDLDRAFSALRRRPLSGTLLQHRTDPTLFVSLGSWTSAEDIEAMRRDSSVQDAFLRVIELCDDAEMNSLIEVVHHEPGSDKAGPDKAGRDEEEQRPEVTIEVAHLELEVQHLEVGHAELTATPSEDESERPRVQEDAEPKRRARRSRSRAARSAAGRRVGE
jgi:heme-degrading monooxygenase HmoA